MEEITLENYKEFIAMNDSVTIENVSLPIGKRKKKKITFPEEFTLETSSVWSFPKRGNWATHYLNARYRGNWAPQVARNLILRYSTKDEIVLDPFVGSGTTLIECKLTGRYGIGVDINRDAAMVTMDRLQFDDVNPKICEQYVFVGDARNLNNISSDSIDFIATHPPYANIIRYSKNANIITPGDLSLLTKVEDFYAEMIVVARELYRVLKKDRYCAILMGDTRQKKHQIPISFNILDIFLKQGFVLKESVIKLQHNTSTEGLWRKQSEKYNFLLLAHEHLFIFRK
jgi:DNA modification methylase